ncbi:MAG TPA: diguanylate cyclase [Bryobacteraceae bacterium]|nr:diguanylate cyclase [Bryobacteraceae bacterium]
MISLKKILQDDGETLETLLRVVRLLLQGIDQHAIEGDPDDLGGFRTGIQKLTHALEGELTASELLVQAGSALHSLEDYNRRTSRYLRRPAGEWQAAVAMLASAMAGMQAGNPVQAGRLRDVAARVRSLTSAEEAHKMRLELAECLTELRLEARVQKDAEAREEPAPSGTAADTVTGLSTRAQAEEALAGAWQTDPPSYVAVMALDRLQIFNMRFGHSVGDEVLRYYGEFLRARLRPGDRLFRWGRQALVALLPRANRLEIVRDELGRVMDARCEHTVQTASRTILLPISSRWTVFPSMAAPRLLVHKIDAFAGLEEKCTT